MRYEVKCNSIGYNGHVYRKGEYVDINSPKEVKRLLGFRNVLVDRNVEPEPEKKETEPVKILDTSAIKGKKGVKQNE